MTAILAMVDNKIDAIVDGANYWSEVIENPGDNRTLEMTRNSTFSDCIHVYIDDYELYEEQRTELLDNNEVEQTDSSATGGVEDWTHNNNSAGTTYAHSTTAHRGRMSVSLTQSAQTTSYWYNTDSIDVSYPQDTSIPAYKFTSYIKTADVADGNGAYFDVLWYNVSDTLLDTDSNSANAMTTTADWTEQTMVKVAPDDASYAVVRLYHNGSQGSAYFDSMKFRKVNWIDSTATADVTLSKTYPHSVVRVVYDMGTTNPLVVELATDLGALYAMSHTLGGTVQGMQYKVDVLTVNKSPRTMAKIGLVKSINENVGMLIKQLGEMGLLRENGPEFELGENVTT